MAAHLSFVIGHHRLFVNLESPYSLNFTLLNFTNFKLYELSTPVSTIDCRHSPEIHQRACLRRQRGHRIRRCRIPHPERFQV